MSNAIMVLLWQNPFFHTDSYGWDSIAYHSVYMCVTYGISIYIQIYVNLRTLLHSAVLAHVYHF